MNRNLSFLRKAIYGGLILLLLVPLFQLGQPATYDKNGRPLSGGWLAELRNTHSLAQASLGDIDPASESMKLATLGMRGVAANLLWGKANEYKKKEDWDGLSATLNQITKLQPNFYTVWEFQGHNLAYNVSVEFDDYRHRYHWVKKGIDFLIKGTEYNREEARLFNTVGWNFGQKLGRSDERLQFRRLFRQDRDYHTFLDSNNYVDMESARVRSRYDQLPDNWLVAREWHVKAESILDNGRRPLRGKSPLIFHRDRPMALVNHAVDLEEEGHFDEVARAAWRDALEDWSDGEHSFGNRLIPSTWGVNLQLNDWDRAKSDVDRLETQMHALAPGAREDILKEKRATLTEEELKVVDVKPEEMMMEFTAERAEVYGSAMRKVQITDQDVVDRAPSETRDRAQHVMRKLAAARTLLDRIDRYRQQVNFTYWQTRCEAEQTEESTQARKYLYEAKELFKKTKLEEAKVTYEKAWTLWAGIIKKYPVLRDDLSAETLKYGMAGYFDTLAQLGEEPPKDFELFWVPESAGNPEANLDYDFGPGPAVNQQNQSTKP